jgi:hypothetical protein
MSFTYDEKLVSNLHKDAYGSRPSAWYMQCWNEAAPSKKQSIWDGLILELEAENAREEEQKLACLVQFKEVIAKVTNCGAGDRVTALRWLTQDENFEHGQAVESWVWSQGILHTGMGSDLVKELCSMYGIFHVTY